MDKSKVKYKDVSILTKYELKTIQSTATLIGMIVRNHMEDFHVKNLTDNQMKELNPLIRNAIFTAIVHLNKVAKGDLDSIKLTKFHTSLIPEYWEKCKMVDI